MKFKIKLLHGTPDDDNRDYLPESVIGTDNVLNENGNNSRPYPERLVEKREVLVDDEEDVWYEYVPESYDPSKKVPLVISNHGGLMTGWGQCIYTSWSYVADREGFIVVFPNAHRNRFWAVERDPNRQIRGPIKLGGYEITPAPLDLNENKDVKFLLRLIEVMKERYNIDEGRIYMQGMSMGDMMTSTIARNYGERLAAAAGSGALAGGGVIRYPDGRIKNAAGHIPYFISLPELNGWVLDAPMRDSAPGAIALIDYWKEINVCPALPEIKIKGEDNFLFFKGEKADFIFHETKNRDHGQTFDDAELVWDYLFSGVRREPDGSISYTESIEPRRGDKFSVAIAEDCTKAWLNGEIVDLGGKAFVYKKLKYHGANGGEIVRGEYLCVPVSFIAKALGAECLVSDGGYTVELVLPDRRHAQFARGSIGCLLDNKIYSMLCEAIYRDGELYLPIEWVFRYLLDMQVSYCRGVLYITDHYIELASATAAVITKLLKDAEE